MQLAVDSLSYSKTAMGPGSQQTTACLMCMHAACWSELHDVRTSTQTAQHAWQHTGGVTETPTQIYGCCNTLPDTCSSPSLQHSHLNLPYAHYVQQPYQLPDVASDVHPITVQPSTTAVTRHSGLLVAFFEGCGVVQAAALAVASAYPGSCQAPSCVNLPAASSQQQS
jgi:hypothetical protein